MKKRKGKEKSDCCVSKSMKEEIRRDTHNKCLSCSSLTDWLTDATPADLSHINRHAVYPVLRISREKRAFPPNLLTLELHALPVLSLTRDSKASFVAKAGTGLELQAAFSCLESGLTFTFG